MKFFRDFLDGPVYIIAVILSIVLIMAIIGFIMERKKLEKEAKERIAYVDNPDATPVQPVSVEENSTSVETSTVSFQPVNNNADNEIPATDDNSAETPVVVFKEPEDKE